MSGKSTERILSSKDIARAKKKLEEIEKNKIVYPEIGSTWKHYKGGTYKILHLARHTETEEVLVIYQSLSFGTYHARPLKIWADIIVETNHQRVRRFSIMN